MTSERILPGVLDYAKMIDESALSYGDLAIDATVGNGIDTLFLAGKVGSEGKVFGFDIQPEALAITRHNLEKEGLSERVDLYLTGHEHLSQTIPPRARGHIRVVMFNLGYLPGSSDRTIVTKPETTIAGLNQALEVLAPGGVITVVVYEGHEGAREESLALQEWASVLDQQWFHVISYRFVNQRNAPPWLLAVEKRK